MSEISQLLAAKFYLPPPRPNRVARARLLEQIRTGLDRAFTLISAPAGYGKTTLLSELAAALKRPIAFLSLDEADNDLRRFYEYLFGALEYSGLITGSQGLITEQISPPAVLTPLINKLSDLDVDILLILDDYHVIRPGPIHEAVLFLLNYLPRNVHLLIATRTDPPLKLAQFRAQGDLCEIRAADLRFRQSETEDFFNQQMALDLPFADIQVLMDKTEGWIVGLQLAAISLEKQVDRRGFVTAFAGDDRFVMDYLLDEVLSHQAEDVQKFLLHIAPLDRFCASLCDAVIAWDPGKSRDIIDLIDQENLFVVPLDNRREWYRFHHLFASLLQHSLAANEQLSAVRLHSDASRWYEDHGQINTALQHAILANDVEMVSVLSGKYIFTVSLRGNRMAFINWVREQPISLLQQHPWVCIAAAWALIDTGHLEELSQYLDCAGKLDEDDERLKCHLLAVRANQASLLEDHDRMVHLARGALKCMDPQDVQLRGMLTLFLAKGEFWKGDLPASEAALIQAYRASLVGGDNHRAIITLTDVAEVQMVRGHVTQAFATLKETLALIDATRRATGQTVVSAAHTHAVFADILIVTGDIQAAQSHNQESLHYASIWGQPRFISNYHLILSSILTVSSKFEAALDEVEKAQDCLTFPGDLVVQEELFITAKAEILIWQGELEAARRLVEMMQIQPSDAITFKQRNEYRVLAQLLIADGAYPTAIKVLEGLSLTCSQADAALHVITSQIIMAKAYSLAGDLEQALQALVPALELAAPEGLLVQPFIDEIESIGKLLYEAATRDIQPGFCRKVLDKISEPVQTLAQSTTGLVEPLSLREQEVLEHIALGSTNQEIAQTLHLSLYTVKSHARNIYGKLGVKNRTEAVARARLLGLLRSQ